MMLFPRLSVRPPPPPVLQVAGSTITIPDRDALVAEDPTLGAMGDEAVSRLLDQVGALAQGHAPGGGAPVTCCCDCDNDLIPTPQHARIIQQHPFACSSACVPACHPPSQPPLPASRRVPRTASCLGCTCCAAWGCCAASRPLTT